MYEINHDNRTPDGLLHPDEIDNLGKDWIATMTSWHVELAAMIIVESDPSWKQKLITILAEDKQRLVEYSISNDALVKEARLCMNRNFNK